MLNGIDISKWQGKMDWAKAKAAGVQFAIIRAGSIDNTTGVCYTDYEFEANVAGCKAQGIPYAFYWFFRPNHSVTKQAEYFLTLAAGKYDDRMAIDLWCDIEVAGDAAKVEAFCELLCQKAVTGIYSNPNTIKYLLTGNKAGLVDFDLWLADWTPPADVPLPWTEWAIWQYAVKPDGEEYGAQSKSIDHNYAQDWLIDTTDEPDPELDLRVRALEVACLDHAKDIGVLSSQLAALTARVAKLESDNTAQGSRFTIGGSRANLRWYKDTDGAGKPIMLIKEPRVQIDPGEVIRVDPAPVVATGGERYYKVMGFSSPDLFVRAVDGSMNG